MRILLADDHREVLSALRLLIDNEPWLDVVGEATDVRSLLAATVELDPQLVLLDWELPGLPGCDVVQELLARRRELAIVALSGKVESERSAMRAGATAFVSKGDPPERLLDVLRFFDAGERM
jgi:DNA-binding NarL/FixJ family response regulator